MAYGKPSYDKPYVPKPNTGSLFANKEKAKPNSPDYRGEVLVNVADLEVVNGVAKVKLSGWKTTASTGLVYLYLMVDTWQPDPNYKKQEQPRQRAASVADEQDDIPF